MKSLSLSYPRSGHQWWRRVLIGGLLMATSPLILPAILLAGYIARVVRDSVAGSMVPPSFSNPFGLLVDGTRWLAVSFVYFLLPTIVAFVGIVLIEFSFTTWGIDVGIVVTGMIVVITLLAYLVASYLLVIGVVHATVTQRFTSGFDLAAIRHIGRSLHFTKQWLILLVFLLIGGLVSGMLSVILLGFFLYFYLLVTGFHLVGQGYSRSLETPTPM